MAPQQVPTLPPAIAAQDRRGELRAVHGFGIALVTIAISLRFLSRYMSKTKLWWDDWIILFALPFIVIMNALSIVATNYGYGKHILAVDMPPLETTGIYLKNLFFQELCYIVNMTCIKFSVIFLYRRLFPTPQVLWVLRVVGAIVIGWFIAIFFAFLFECTPVHKAWDVMAEGTCVNIYDLILGNAIPTITTDLIIIFFPVRLVWQLKLRTVQKVSVSCIFLLGLFVTGVSLYRLVVIIRGLDVQDVTWSYVDVDMWSCIEINLACVCACLPSMRPLFRKMGLFGKGNGSTNAYGKDGSSRGKSGGGSKNQWSLRGNDNFRKIKDPNAVTVGETEVDYRGDETDASNDGNSWNSEAKMHGHSRDTPIPLDRIRIRNDIRMEYEQRGSPVSGPATASPWDREAAAALRPGPGLLGIATDGSRMPSMERNRAIRNGVFMEV